MARPQSSEFTKEWKIHVEATIAGKVEHLLFDTMHGRPMYGARKKLIEALLENWLETVVHPENPPRPTPSLAQIRELAI